MSENGEIMVDVKDAEVLTELVEAAIDERIEEDAAEASLQEAEPEEASDDVVEEVASVDDDADDDLDEDAEDDDLDEEEPAEDDDDDDEDDLDEVEEDEEESDDSLTFSNGVIEKIVAIAMRDVPGVVGMKGGWINRIQDAFGASDARKGVTVEVTPDSSVRVSVSVLIEYGSFAPKVFEDVKSAIVQQVTGMTGLRVAGVNLRIEDVLTAEEVAARRALERVNAEQPVALPIPEAVEAEA